MFIICEVLILSVEIIEEIKGVEVSKPDHDFLPPAVSAVRFAGRNVFNIICAGFLLLASLALFIYDFVAGTLVFAIGLLLLASWIVNFKKSKNPNGGFGLSFQRLAYFISAVLLAVISQLDEFTVTNRLLIRFSELLCRLSSFVPEQFETFVNRVFNGADTVALCLAFGCLCTALSFGSLNRSRRKNLPYTKTLFLSSIVTSLLGVFLALKGLKELNLIIPCRCPIDPKTAWPNAILFFAFAIVLLLFAVRLLIIYIRMRKVKNAVLKA